MNTTRTLCSFWVRSLLCGSWLCGLAVLWAASHAEAQPIPLLTTDEPAGAAALPEAPPAAPPAGVQPSPAADTSPGQPGIIMEEFELSEERVVTAARFEQKVAEAPAIVQVIPARRFRELGIETVADALALVAGIFVRPARTSQQTAVFRGIVTTDNNKFLLLVDGVPWRDAVYGWAWIDRYLALANVRQIELIRGPGSALYGSNAFAGVINIITRKGEHLKGVQAGASVGSYWRHELWANGGDLVDTPVGRLNVAAYARYFEEQGDGINFSTKNVRRVGARDPHVGLSGGFFLEFKGLTFKWDTVNYQHGRLDGGVATLKDALTLLSYNYLNHFLDLRYDLDLPANLHLQPRFFYQHYQNGGSYLKCVKHSRIVQFGGDGIQPFPGSSCYYAPSDDPAVVKNWTDETLVEPVKETRRFGAGLELQHSYQDINRFVLGFEWEGEQIKEVEDVAYVNGVHIPGEEVYKIENTPLRIDDFAFYAQDTLRLTALGGLGLTLGARVGSHRTPRKDENEQTVIETFNHFSPRAGLVYSFDKTDRWVVKLLYGQAYRAPTARELLVVSDEEVGWAAGEPTLKPEEIRTIEGEVTLRPWPWLTWQTSGYANLVADEIIEEDKTYARSKGLRVYGVNTELRVTTKPFEGMVNFSWTDAQVKIEDPAQPGETMLRTQYGVPVFLGNLMLSAHLTRNLSATAIGRYVGEQPRAVWHEDERWKDTQREDGAAFATLDLHLHADELLGGKLGLTVSARNLLDSDVVYILESDRSTSHTTDYQLGGRSFMVQLDSKF